MAVNAEQMDILRVTGANIARYRVDRGLSVRALAQLVKVEPATLDEIEAGRATDFDIDMLAAIADALDEEAYRLVMREGNMGSRHGTSTDIR